MQEYSLSINEFNQPVVYDDKKALYIKLIRLLLLEPGTYQSNPEMGVGIVSRYRYSTEVDISDLKYDIETQVNDYIPDLTSVSVDLEPDYSNNLLYIKAYMNNILFEITFNTTTLKLESQK